MANNAYTRVLIRIMVPHLIVLLVGIEPTFPPSEGDVLSIERREQKYKVVPEVGVEPTCLAASDFKSLVYTNSTTRASTERTSALY